MKAEATVSWTENLVQACNKNTLIVNCTLKQWQKKLSNVKLRFQMSLHYAVFYLNKVFPLLVLRLFQIQCPTSLLRLQLVLHILTQQTFAGLEDVLKTCLEDVLKMSWRYVLKTSWRFYAEKENTYWGYLYTYLGITNLNVYLTNLYFTNLYLTILTRIENALIRTQ